MTRIVLRFSVYAGGLLIALAVVPTLFGAAIDPEQFKVREIIGYGVMVVAMGLIFFALRKIRDEHLGGVITFGQAVKYGMLTNLATSTIFGLFNIVYLRFIEPEFLQAYLDYYVEQIRSNASSAEEAAKTVADLDASRDLWLNPEFNAALMFATVFLIGLAVVLISALVLRTRERRPA